MRFVDRARQSGIARLGDALRDRIRGRCTVAVIVFGVIVVITGPSCSGQRSAAAAHDDRMAAVLDTIGRAPADSAPATPDSAVVAPVPTARAAPAPPRPALSPLADSISQFLVFAPTVQTWFLAAKRGKRLLMDIGRVDLDLTHDKRRTKAYMEAVTGLSPVTVGGLVRLYDAWGTDTAVVSGFADWNGRIVATLKVPPHLDSVVRKAPAAYAAAQLVDTATVPDTAQRADSARRADSSRLADSTRRADSARRANPTPRPDTLLSAAARDTCRRDSVAPELLARAVIVRDSLELWLRSLPPPPYERLVATEKTYETQVWGCFGGPNRLAIAVDLRAGANEWIRERMVLLDTLGRVTSLKVDDFRLKGHDLLGVLDPNAAGIDGIVARGVTEASGATVILALGPRNHLFRWVSGFAWESR